MREGDALDALRSLPSGSAGAIVTDPPYCSGGSTEATRQHAKCQGVVDRVAGFRWFAGDNMTTPGLVWMLRAVAFEAERLLPPGGSLLAFTDWRMWATLAPALESGGLRLTSMIVWDKGNPGMGRGFRPSHELVVHLTNGLGAYYSHSGTNVLSAKRIPGLRKEHPTEKPVDLLRAMIRVVAAPGSLVVDPFAGSGSTGVAALLEGRRFLGIERDAEYAATARRRLSEVTSRSVIPALRGLS